MDRIVIFHKVDGPKEMYLIDANHALASFPDEWSKTPYMSKDEQKALKAQKDQEDQDEYNREQALKNPSKVEPVPLPDLSGDGKKDSKAS